MRHIGLFAFGLTTAVLVPAALRQLDAGPEQVARLAAPNQQTLELGGAKIDVATDRALVDSGDKVRVKFHGAVPSGKAVTVEVLVMESRGSSGGRVEDPPRMLDRGSVTLTAASPDNELAFRLPGFRGTDVAGRAPLGRYTILVMPPEAADRLARLHHHARTTSGGEFAEAYRYVGRRPDPDAELREPSAYELEMAKVIGKPMETARLDVQTRVTDARVAIAAPSTGKVADDLAVKVTVTNRTKHALPNMDVHLATPSYRVERTTSLAADKIVVAESTITVDLAPYETKDVTFHVTAREAGLLGLYASMSCRGSENYDLCQRVGDGQIDAIEITGGSGPQVAAD